MRSHDTLLAHAQAVLHQNDRGNYTAPSLALYPHQWLWDSCFTAIGLRHIDLDRAETEILSLLKGQWRNGMLPHIIFDNSRGYRLHRDLWRSWQNPDSPLTIATSGITQPPLVAEAVSRIGELLSPTERLRWYRQIWQPLLSYHEWLYAERDPRREGLVVQVHPWETGLDNSPPWMSQVNFQKLSWWFRLAQGAHLDILGRWLRRDIRSIPATQRLSTMELFTLFAAQQRLRQQAYNTPKMLEAALFLIEDLAFNCILIRANTLLQGIAHIIHSELPPALVKQMRQSEEALEQLWDPDSQQYYSRNFRNHQLIKVASIATLLPLYAGCISKQQAKQLVQYLENDHLFGTPFPVPSVPANSSWFNPERYWQGPSWVNMNWLVIDGLARYGFKNHAAVLRESTLEMVTRSGYFEYFHPSTGSGLGVSDFSWTAALTIDLLHQ